MKALIDIQNALAARRDERGAAMAEYGLLLALVALAAIAILTIFGESITGVFTAANESLNENIEGTPAEPAGE